MLWGNSLLQGQWGLGSAAQRLVGAPSLEVPEAMDDGALDSLSWWRKILTMETELELDDL